MTNSNKPETNPSDPLAGLKETPGVHTALPSSMGPTRKEPCAYLSVRQASRTRRNLTKSAFVPLYPGLYIMSGPAGSGKTFRGLTFASSFRKGAGADSARLPFAYFGFLEPRISSTLTQLSAGPVSLLLKKEGFTGGSIYSQVAELFEKAQGMGDRIGEFSVASALFSLVRLAAVEQKHPAIVLDSLTNALGFVGSTVMGKDQDATLPGGIRRSEIMGVLLLDALFSSLNLAVLGTVNSELFPRADILEGVCEGRISLVSRDTFRMRDRGDRTWRAFGYDADASKEAADIFGSKGEPKFTSYDSPEETYYPINQL